MPAWFRNSVLALTTAAIAITAVAPANAGEFRRKGMRDFDERTRVERVMRDDHTDEGALIAAGIIGLAAVAIIAGAQRRSEPAYVEPQPHHRRKFDRDFFPDQPSARLIQRPRHVEYREQPVYRQQVAIEPWTHAWFAYCQDTYRTFDPRRGTFMGHDGQRHFCVAD
jgi:hypothetical protein